MSESIMFTTARAWQAEGARVGLVICTLCGSALLLDPDEPIDVMDIHRAWHDEVEGA